MQVMTAAELADLFTLMAQANPLQVIGIEYTMGSAVSKLYPHLSPGDVRDCLSKGKDLAEVDRLAERISKAKEKYN